MEKLYASGLVYIKSDNGRELLPINIDHADRFDALRLHMMVHAYMSPQYRYQSR